MGWEVGAAARSARGAPVATLAPGGCALRPGRRPRGEGNRGRVGPAGTERRRGAEVSASGRERRQRGGSTPYSASRSSRVCARLSVCLPRTDAAAAAGLGDGLGGPSRTASASPRSIFKAASGLGRPPALPSLAPARPPGPLGSRPPLGVSRQGFGGGEGPRAAPPHWGLSTHRPPGAGLGGGGGGPGFRPRGLTSPGSSPVQSRLLGSTCQPGWPQFPHWGEPKVARVSQPRSFWMLLYKTCGVLVKKVLPALSVKSPYIFIGKGYLGTPWTSTFSFVMSLVTSVWS